MYSIVTVQSQAGAINRQTIFNSKALSLLLFAALQKRFSLPTYKFYYIQLQHAISAQGGENVWTSSPTPFLHLISSVIHAKDNSGWLSLQGPWEMGGGPWSAFRGPMGGCVAGSGY